MTKFNPWHSKLGVMVCLFAATIGSIARAQENAPSQTEPVVPPAPASSPQTSPPDPSVYRLDQLVRMAEQSNPLLSRDLARIDEARGTAVQAGIYPNPRLDSGNSDQFAGINSEYSTGYLQTIVTAGKLGLQRAAATEGVRQAEFAYHRDRYNLVHRVRAQFYTVLAAQERTRTLQQTKEIVDQAEQTGTKLLNGGLGNRTDVLALAIEARRTDVAFRNSMALEGTGKQQLAVLVGLPQLVISRVEGNLFAEPPHFEADAVRRTIIAQNVEIQIAQLEIARRQCLLRRAEVEPIPDPDAGVGYQWSGLEPHNQFLLYVATPIPLWNQNQGGIAAAAAGVRESVESVAVVQTALLAHAAEATGRYEAAVQQAEEYRLQILPKAKEALNLARSGYAGGEFDFNRFLQAERTLVDSRLRHIDALDSLWNTATELARLLQLETFP